MKHLKLYENFDRYEFGEFKGDYDLLYLRDLYSDIKQNVEQFSMSEHRLIVDILGGEYRVHSTVTNAGRCIRFTKLYGNQYVIYDVYYLGDYCYCMTGYTNNEELGEMSYDSVCYFEIFDGFDSLCEKLQTLK